MNEENSVNFNSYVFIQGLKYTTSKPSVVAKSKALVSME